MDSCRVVNFHTRALRRFRRFCTVDTASTLAVGIIGSRLDYCSTLLCGTSRANITKLQRAQNNVARVVMLENRRDNAWSLLQTLHWLPVEQHMAFRMALITFKVLKTGEPGYLRRLLSCYSPVRHLRSNDTGLLSVPRVRNSNTSRSFSCTAPRIWNALPAELRLFNGSVETFKRKLKTHFYSTAFSC